MAALQNCWVPSRNSANGEKKTLHKEPEQESAKLSKEKMHLYHSKNLTIASDNLAFEKWLANRIYNP